MSSEHHEVFVRESDEQITELNNALLRLESDPDDREAMDAIFRTAHTLKGNAGAMGFDGVSSLAHAIEDLLDEIRNGAIAVDPEIMDLVFAGVDDIDASLDQLEAAGEVTRDHDVIDEIRSLIDERSGAGGDSDAGPTGDSADEAAGEDPADDDADDGAAVAAEDDAGDAGGGDRDDADDGADDAAGDDAGGDDDTGVADAETLRAARELLDGAAADPESALYATVAVDGSGMEGVDAMLALGSVVDDWDVLGTDPDRQAIEDGEFADGFSLVVAGADSEALEATLDDTRQVGDFAVTPVPEAVDVAGAGDGGTDDGSDVNDADDDSDGGDADDSSKGDDADDGSDGGDADDGSDGGDSRPGRSSATSVDDIKSVRVDVGQLDDLHGLVEQLVTSRIKLRRGVEEDQQADALDNLDELDKITTHLQDTVMDMRLIPLKKVVSKFPRLVRDLAREEEKQVDFAIEGEDIELDRTILTQISDPLMHVLRNAVDHGIEPPAAREAAGKPPEGRIELRADRERDHVIIEVEDDGRGLDVEAIREKAAEKGVVSETELDAMDDSAVYDLVFHPGFSTSEEVTDVSGRGVGMDVVHSTVKQLDGSVSVESDPGAGTTVRLRLPVTVAIVTVLFVRVDDQRYGIPIKAIDEISRVQELRTINGREVVEHGDDLYPVIRLGDSLDVDAAAADGGTVRDESAEAEDGDAPGGSTAPANGDAPGGSTAPANVDTPDGVSTGPPTDDTSVGVAADDGMLLRIRKSERKVALYCDVVEDQEEVVVKPLEGVLSGIPGLSGTAVLGDGNIVPILDVVTL